MGQAQGGFEPAGAGRCEAPARDWRPVATKLFSTVRGDVEAPVAGCMYELGELTLIDSGHEGMVVERTAGHTRRDGIDRIVCALDLQDTEMEIGGVTRHVPAGVVTLWDLGRPSAKRMSAGRHLSMGFERSLAQRAGLLAGDVHGVALGQAGGIVAQHIKSLNAALQQGSAFASADMAEASARLVAACLPAATFEATDNGSLALGALVERTQQVIARRMGDVDLDPEVVAGDLGVSRTSLYRAFAAQGGVALAIRNARLRAAREALGSARDTRRVNQIAFACGFRNDAHFSRAFRSAYGVSPREFRAESRFRAEAG